MGSVLERVSWYKNQGYVCPRGILVGLLRFICKFAYSKLRYIVSMTSWRWAGSTHLTRTSRELPQQSISTLNRIKSTSFPTGSDAAGPPPTIANTPSALSQLCTTPHSPQKRTPIDCRIPTPAEIEWLWGTAAMRKKWYSGPAHRRRWSRAFFPPSCEWCLWRTAAWVCTSGRSADASSGPGSLSGEGFTFSVKKGKKDAAIEVAGEVIATEEGFLGEAGLDLWYFGRTF